MNNIDDDLIQRYIAIYREEFREDISTEEASKQLSRLTTVLSVIREHQAEMAEKELGEENSSSVQLPLF